MGHLKYDHATGRCWLQGATGDALRAVLCATADNISRLLRASVRLQLKGLVAPLIALPATLITGGAMVVARKNRLGSPVLAIG